MKGKCWTNPLHEGIDSEIILSGAGKTVSAKFIMRYFATADDQEISNKKKKPEGSMTEVEEQILGNINSIERR